MEAEWARESMRPEGERIEALRHCVEKLPARSRQILDLRYSQVARARKFREPSAQDWTQSINDSPACTALRECIEKRVGAMSPPGLEA